MDKLAILGGQKAVQTPAGDLFHWPIITAEDEEAALDVLRRGAMSGIDVTKQFEAEFAAWQGTRFALGYNNGTAALQGAMFGVGVGAGDEVICPSMTYWASALPCLALGATPVFVDIDPVTLCLDPNQIERRIGPRTKAIVVVHYFGYPADMDPILEIARRHGLKVIEDVSHAQGGRYRGRKLGTLGDVGAMSLMAGKSLAIGEAGMLVTDDREILERAIAFGHYERFQPGAIETESLQPFVGLPMGGYKHRMHQVSSAVGRVQLKYYDARCAEIRQAMNYFWDLLEGLPGVRPHRVDEASTGSDMAGWYAAHGHYLPEELEGLSLSRFCEAVRAEGGHCAAGSNLPLHLHPLLQCADVYRHGRPTRLAHAERDVREEPGDLPVTERLPRRTYYIPWFKHFYRAQIEEHARAYQKVIASYKALLDGDPGDPETVGGFASSRR